MVDYHAIGTPTPRVDGVEKVTGRALYAGDRRLPGMLTGRLLHSHRPHARIVRIDTSAARALPGVHAVITGDDVRGHLYGRRIKDMPVLADGLVRYFGERVAAVAAEDEETARRAVDLIEVEYEDLPAVFDVVDAIAPGAPLLHPAFGTYPGTQPLDVPSNAYDHTVTERGDFDGAFAEADFVFERTFSTQRMHQAYLEPHTSLVSVTDGRAHIWTNTKAPHSIREVLTVTLGLAPEQIVLHHSHIGGDFGGKGTPLDLPIAYFLAQASGRPVRMVADYVEEFMAGNPRHATLTRFRTAVMRDGTITAHHVEYFVNSGAYAAYKPGGRIGGATRAAGPYRIPNTRIESIHVYTNSVPGGHMRAPGGPQGVFALESHLDAIARELDIDPLEFRMHNLIAEGDEPASGDQITRPRVRETLQAAADAAGYRDAKALHVGRGMAIGDHGAGGGVGNAEVTIHPDGAVTLGTAIFDQGSGTYTTLAQVVAEELGVPVDRIRFEIWDTDGTGGEDDSGIGGSRATRVNTVAAHAAAQDARTALTRVLAAQLGVAEADVALRGPDVLTPGGEPHTWAAILAEVGRSVTGRSHVDERGPTHMTGFAAQIAEVAVDPETGQVTVLKITSAHDVGRVLNPIGHQGQINGGVIQGLGYALMEELTFADGQVTSLSFGDYKIPTMRDVPQLTTVLLEPDNGIGPYQIKGIGETPNTPVAAAIANAIADAVGIRISDLPITAEKVYRALQNRGAAAQ
ncbi:MAG: xanthine dehydrogenase family protein molybdopterin-binding subunit [Chloroflexi bacterium]|nr:xanthine dehydrogenase family protein molybdopterin-binding subunit [Chloroflexota bacterium]MDA1004328.1 xanthine dehydrogenase family protein molybdopterin-binding subunit [Chloroflexota bacterium]